MRVDRVPARTLTQPMNASKALGFALALIGTTLIIGCSTAKREPVYAEVPGLSAAPTNAQAQESAAAPAVQTAVGQAQPAADEQKPQVIVTPDNMLKGSIVSVNDVGRFVVLTFPLGRMPAVGSTLFVYRQGLKVAELKVSGPQKDDHTVADIRSGECQVKDEVRDQ